MSRKSKQTTSSDQILDDYLQGDSELSTAYDKTEKVNVPEYLDRNILAAANAAVKTKQDTKVAYSPFTRHWSVPASLAAVLVVCVGLVFSIYQDSGQVLLTAPTSEYDSDSRIAPMTPASKDRALNKREAKQAQSGVLTNAPAMQSRDDLSKDDMSGHNLSGSDSPERVQAADVKKQKQSDTDEFSRRLGDSDMNIFEQDGGSSTDQALRYRQEAEELPAAKESLQVKENDLLNDKLLNKNTLEDGAAAMDSLRQIKPDTVISTTEITEQNIAEEKLTSSEQRLKQINELWLAGDRDLARKSLKQFFQDYPDYPVAEIRKFLDASDELLEDIK